MAEKHFQKSFILCFDIVSYFFFPPEASQNWEGVSAGKEGKGKEDLVHF